ncbi:MAG: lycopene beta-cyclase CrtY [Kofleriaceae bacterium]
MSREVDYALVGGGLQNGLLALALRARQPNARVAIIERGATLGGNHTWCFHAGDVTSAMAAWIDPVVAVRWPGYDVAFPGHTRTLDSAYACVTSARLAAAVASSGCELLLEATALVVGADHVLVRSCDGVVGELRARAVIDARGPDRADVAATGWQKFIGQDLRLAAPHGLTRPMLMDATVEQLDGFRFMYVLPLAADRVLVEDTYFANGTHLDATVLRERIAAYVAARGWQIVAVEREESGVLPLPLRCAPPVAACPLVAGYAGGWFHPVTGYSFPIAARLAELIAAQPPEQLAGKAIEYHARAHAKQLAFGLRLNRMLFRWFAPAQRYRVLERFYRLPEASVRRFYALELTAWDRARILVGRPPRGMSFRAMFGGQP